MKFTVVTLFPQLVESFAQDGLVGQAKKRGQIEIETLNPRLFTSDAHHTVDDRVFGGGDGMAMKFDPLAKAIETLRSTGPVHVAVLSPQGARWNQKDAVRWANRGGHVALICGRYAGIDNRFNIRYADQEISLGDFILNGGEVAACAVMESVVRLRPGVLGNSVSSERDSFSNGLLECPQFTRPREAGDLPVPSPLLSGHHKEIAAFESAVSRVRTALLRPDLLAAGPELSADVDLLSSLNDHELLALGLRREHLPKALGKSL